MTTIVGPTLVDRFRGRTAVMVDEIRRVVERESPSGEPSLLSACAIELTALAQELTGVTAEPVESGGLVHLRWRFGAAPAAVLLIGHYDTVWPRGTLQRLPCAVSDDRLSGPGCFDMKAGVVMALEAVAALDGGAGVELLVTADEEVGSLTSRALIEEAARGKRAALVLEPALGRAVKVERKGVAMYRLGFSGRAAHAGLDPERGANALLALAHAAPRLAALSNPSVGTTVTPTVASAGSASNVVPAAASLTVDVRATSPAEFDRVDESLRGLAAEVDGVSVVVDGGVNRPALSREAAAGLFVVAQQVAAALGLDPLEAVAVGGASDGNFTAGLGVPTLDGLGAVGGGAHADDEHVIVSALAERTALVTGLIAALTA